MKSFDVLRGIGHHRAGHGVDQSMFSWCLPMNGVITPKKSI